MATKRRLTVFFTDGKKTTFSFPKQADMSSLATEVQRALDSDKITIEADGVLIMIPLSNVKYLQVTPAPEKLPPGVIKGATIK